MARRTNLDLVAIVVLNALAVARDPEGLLERALVSALRCVLDSRAGVHAMREAGAVVFAGAAVSCESGVFSGDERDDARALATWKRASKGCDVALALVSWVRVVRVHRFKARDVKLPVRPSWWVEDTERELTSMLEAVERGFGHVGLEHFVNAVLRELRDEVRLAHPT